MNVNVTGAYIYFTIPILGGIDITQTTVSVFLVTVILALASYFLGRNLTKRPGKLQVLTEKGVIGLACDLVQIKKELTEIEEKEKKLRGMKK